MKRLDIFAALDACGLYDVLAGTVIVASFNFWQVQLLKHPLMLAGTVIGASSNFWQV